jgi:hypothetical protein
MIYKQQNNTADGSVNPYAIQRISPSGVISSIPCVPDNTDYMTFKQALTTGMNADGTAVELQDATGIVMTSAQITTFLETLP